MVTTPPPFPPLPPGTDPPFPFSNQGPQGPIPPGGGGVGSGGDTGNLQDLYLSPATQVRDTQVIVRTPSLLEAGNTPVPDEILRDLFDQQWIVSPVAPKPQILIKDEQIQGDLAKGDYILIECGAVATEWEGYRHEFFNVTTPVILDIRTTASRQRLWNLMAECRRIVVKFIVALAPYHSLYWNTFTPEYVGPRKWQGTVEMSLVQQGLPAFLGFVRGQEFPAGAPNVAPQKVLP